MNLEDKLAAIGLKKEEYELLKEKLKREPLDIELEIASAMWSEHCSYKSSKLHLKKLPTKGERVVIGPGENAGVIDVGDGYVAVFKMESHNHPSFIEPYQGAATGVGGILRDVFTMGARPVMNMDGLFFGDIEFSRTKFLIDGVVRGIGDYGNCVGVPTIGGMTFFDEYYNTNNLVNAFCLGLGKKDRIFLGVAKGVGNPVFYVGSKTGKDGIHGATMASASFDENFEDERPAVQVGDPFTEKLLLEACLELMNRDIIEGIQDMGAAGLTSSSFEMADRGGVGLELYLDRVPVREKLTPSEIMLSESQERMLIIAKKGREEEIKQVFRKWSLDAEVIGKVIEEKSIKLFWKDELIADIDVGLMASNSPVYRRPTKKPTYIETIEDFNFENLEEPSNYNDVLIKLFSTPEFSTKKPLYEQYDSTVQDNTILKPGSDAALIRIKETGKGIAASLDVNPRYVYINPQKGTELAVLESFRNLITVGATPVALTDCLNFGNPENPEIMWQFEQSIIGMKTACENLGVAVVSGNVSFYNETSGKNIHPTPAVGMVGVISKPLNAPSIGFKKDRSDIYLVGRINPNELGGSAYLKWIFNKTAGRLPQVDYQLHKKLLSFMVEAVDSGLIRAAHDVSEGGILITLAEMCVSSLKGAKVELYIKGRKDLYLFSESQGAIVIEADSDVIALAERFDLTISRIGTVEGYRLKVNDIIDIDVLRLKKENERFFGEVFGWSDECV
ncbi:phosphoribosylformylglycinamidine synthase subunit PurL [Hippea maritima]|uniref:Phosphoribosylformylglycinamidine synthase subunit PurL n=1 Tax=Hippea maritima (strain ATCC 700847 / DSM 10411 / MH2) TaxID=760142 RepID=F2LVK3_HIPMA|nr:phosphoribosylformylglycinamidine synthase subunit PurL [Hippea maritima]AEA33787.1 Phosphoribosylformylglycinamidine synthase 2 [Hippea maritima DSM 10411]